MPRSSGRPIVSPSACRSRCRSRPWGVRQCDLCDTAETRIDVTSVGQWKYVFDVTSWSAFVAMDVQLIESRDQFHLECKLHFLCAQFMLRQIYVSESIEAKYTMKTALNSAFFAVNR